MSARAIFLGGGGHCLHVRRLLPFDMSKMDWAATMDKDSDIMNALVESTVISAGKQRPIGSFPTRGGHSSSPTIDIRVVPPSV